MKLVIFGVVGCLLAPFFIPLLNNLLGPLWWVSHGGTDVWGVGGTVERGADLLFMALIAAIAVSIVISAIDLRQK